QAENGGRALVIKDLVSADAGVYIAHYARERYIYSAATRLIVRDCPMNKWSLNCSRPCIVCNHGGVCSASTGECVCPMGFIGRHCEQACPSNLLGPSCLLRCDDITNDVTCRGVQMCQTTGCRCATGWKGPNCDEACLPNTYGPDCHLRCLCHNNGTCDAQRGCICTPGWFGPSCKSRLLRHATVMMSQYELFQVNQNQEVTVECSVSGIPLPGQGEIVLIVKNEEEIYPVLNSMTSSETTSSFAILVTSFYPGPFRCKATTSAGSTSKEFNFTISELPTPRLPPFLISRSATRLVIGLNSRNYSGDGPIRKSEVWFKSAEERFYRIFERQPTSNDTMVIYPLQPATQYNIRVVLFREGGDSGEGVPGPVADVTTDCDYPTSAPRITLIYAIGNTTLFLQWEIPPRNELNGPVLGHKIFYRELGELYKVKSAQNHQNTATVKKLKPLAVYMVRMKLYNCAGDSPTSKPARVTMGKLAPSKPVNLHTDFTTSDKIHLIWGIPERPNGLLRGYELEVRKEAGPWLPINEKLTNLTDYLVQNLGEYTSYHFRVRTKTNKIGPWSDVINVITMSTVPLKPPLIVNVEKSSPQSILMAVLGGIVAIIATVFIIVYCRWVPWQRFYTDVNNNVKCTIDYYGLITSQIFPESLVIPWENISFEDIPLGVGNFGQVVKAVVRKDGELIQTAVKMLKDGCTLEDKHDFHAELDTMVGIGYHRHVVTLVGTCEHDNVMYLCTEFAPLGSLLQFLRKSRRLENSEKTYTSLSQSQLLKFAHDITLGMTYLSEKQIIHRDLAARNILLGDGYVCKIADFGLSRGEGVYVKKTVSRLPIRWMAIESLNYNVYTTKSDVWSFGILLWEIVSLGGTPYCGMSCTELFEKLPTGYRMEKPLNCDGEVFGIMCQCWKNRPYDRPTFAQLSIALERMCDARSSRNYVNTAIFEDFKFANIDVNEEEA
uniref:receptor protein-tyrosine kinase n=1 Tax=Ciona savignyi TaxID=51511 RepID=H2YM10_CIOSA